MLSSSQKGFSAKVRCPKCGGMLYRKKGKNLILCKTEGCGYKTEVPEEADAPEADRPADGLN